MPAQVIPRQPPLAFGPFTFDPQSRLLSRDGQEIAVPPRALGVLELLVRRAGEVVPRQELIDSVWKDAFVSDTSLAEAVSLLRQLLGDDPQAPTYIQTLHRRGYRFVARVAPAPAPAGSDPVPAPPGARLSPSIARELVPWSVAVICTMIAIAAVWQYTRKPPAAPVAARFAIELPGGWSFDDRAPALAFSPDGTMVAWSACDQTGCRIFTRSLDRLEPAAVAGTESGRAPFFSPDGRWLGFFANGRLAKVALAGGAAVTLADAPSALGGCWLDREIIFAASPSGGLMRVSADGGEPRPLTIPREADGEVNHTWPALVPGTDLLLFTISRTPAASAGTLAVLSLNAPNGPRSSTWRTLLENVSLARALGSDIIVFSRGAELHVARFDSERMALSSAPSTIQSGVAAARGRAHFALSEGGSIVYAAGDQASRTLVFLQTPGQAGLSMPQNLALREPSISPDGRRVAGVNQEGPGAGIWVSESERANPTRLVHKDINASPIWSGDGASIFFASRSNGLFEIWRKRVDGNEPAVRLFGADRHTFPVSASPDGRLLAFVQTGDTTRTDIWVFPLAGGPTRLVVQTPFDDVAASFSPDSDLLAVQSAETGRWEIYVHRLADGRRVLVSSNGGENPVWTRDGLYYQSGANVMRATVTTMGDGIRVEAGPSPHASLDDGTSLEGVAADGQLLLSRGSGPFPAKAIVTLDWRRQVRAALGPPAAELPR